MPSSTWSKIVVFLAAGVWLAVALAMGLDVDQSWVKPLGIVTSVVTVLLLAFDTIAWKWLPLRLTKIPNLNGTWHATLTSSHPSPAGGPTVMDCFLLVRQSYSKIHVEMLFPKSESTSTSASLVHTDGTAELWYSYRSEAHALDRENNPPHKGGVQLRIATNGDVTMAGSYWTDRMTFGRVQTTAHKKEIVNDYGKACRQFGVESGV